MKVLPTWDFLGAQGENIAFGANAPELTFNASGTWFNSTAAGRGRLRDARASPQLNMPLMKEIQNIGRFTLSFSAQYQKLFSEQALHSRERVRRKNSGLIYIREPNRARSGKRRPRKYWHNI